MSHTCDDARVSPYLRRRQWKLDEDCLAAEPCLHVTMFTTIRQRSHTCRHASPHGRPQPKPEQRHRTGLARFRDEAAQAASAAQHSVFGFHDEVAQA